MPVLKLPHVTVSSFILLAGWLFGVGIAPSAQAQTDAAAPLRTWHAATGGFKVEAELVDVREKQSAVAQSRRIKLMGTARAPQFVGRKVYSSRNGQGARSAE